MTAPITFGLGIQSDKTADAYARLAVAGEELGFDVLSVFSDLMYQPPIFPLTVMARHTRRVRLGPACLNPFSMHPYEIAGQIAALDIASDGRAYFGIARGTWLDAVGVVQDRPLAHIRETVEVVRRLLGGDDGGFEGEVFRLAPGARLRFATRRPEVPLLVGTWGRRLAGLAARLDAAEVKVGGSANPDFVPLMRNWLADGAAGTGRPRAPRVVLGAVTVVDRDGVAARALARREVAMYLAVVAGFDPTLTVDPELIAKVRALVSAGDESGAGLLIPDDVLDRFAFSGTPEQVAAQVERLIAAGVDRVEFGTPHGLRELDGIELLGREVLPRFRGA